MVLVEFGKNHLFSQARLRRGSLTPSLYSLMTTLFFVGRRGFDCAESLQRNGTGRGFDTRPLHNPLTFPGGA